jgi:hypothetical protein
MAWAIEQQEITEPSGRLVLICLCNYADAGGDSIFPSLHRLSQDTGLGERALRYQLRKLEKAAVLYRSNPAIAAAKIKRKDRLPICYRVNITRGNPLPPDSSRGAIPVFTGGNLGQNGGQPVAPDPSLILKTEPLQDFVNDFTKRFGGKPKIQSVKG